jgi:hypothetical protein
MANKNCHEVGEDPHALVVVQCDTCGFTLGVDATYLRHWPVQVPCPHCKTVLEIEEIE